MVCYMMIWRYSTSLFCLLQNLFMMKSIQWWCGVAGVELAKYLVPSIEWSVLWAVNFSVHGPQPLHNETSATTSSVRACSLGPSQLQNSSVFLNLDFALLRTPPSPTNDRILDPRGFWYVPHSTPLLRLKEDNYLLLNKNEALTHDF